MFDSGGSSGQLRDELGVLPPGDMLKCALALARNAREARRVLLARLPTLEHARLGGHTGGNLLLSMMQRYSGDFLDADRRTARAARLPRPRLAGQRRAGVGLRRIRRRLDDARRSRGRRGPVVAGDSCGASGSSRRSSIHPAVADGDRGLRRRDHRPRQLLHQPDADLPRARRRRSAARDERSGHPDREPADRRARHGRLHRRRRGARASRRRSTGRSTSSSPTRSGRRRKCSAATRSSTRSRSRSGELPAHCELVGGEFWTRRHRASRSPAARVCGVERAVASACSQWRPDDRDGRTRAT